MTKLRRDNPIPGVLIRQGRKGQTIFELDYWADPERDQAWADAMRNSMDESDWEREFLRNWNVAKGLTVYPEFRRNKSHYVLSCPSLIPDVIYRGWDFGYRCPACIWFQYSRKTRRIWFLREVVPRNLETHAFRNLVLYLSGQRDMDWLMRADPATPRAIEWVRKIEEDEGYPKPPWFEDAPSSPNQFVDFTGPEALIRAANVAQSERHPDERSAREILATEGIDLQIYSMQVLDRVGVMRKTLLDRKDGYPGALWDPACKLWIAAMAGGLTYPKPTPTEPLPNHPMKDGFWDNIHDAGSYGAVNVFELAEPPPAPEPTKVWQGREQVVIPNDVILTKEVMRSVW